jgi:hypothetical protein
LAKAKGFDPFIPHNWVHITHHDIRTAGVSDVFPKKREKQVVTHSLTGGYVAGMEKGWGMLSSRFGGDIKKAITTIFPSSNAQ